MRVVRLNAYGSPAPLQRGRCWHRRRSGLEAVSRSVGPGRGADPGEIRVHRPPEGLPARIYGNYSTDHSTGSSPELSLFPVTCNALGWRRWRWSAVALLVLSRGLLSLELSLG